MEKIGGSGRSYSGKSSSSSRKKVSKKGLDKLSFSSFLDIDNKEITGINSVDYSDLDLEDIMDRVHETGEQLKELPTLDNVKSYKLAVSGFLKFVVKNSLTAETRAGANFNPLKKQKRYTIIRIVDEKLERLAAGVLQNQGDNLFILEKIEEINGLIVDLLK
ncbi:MAG: YaaR family protein [Spirochaetales bacterium]|nr:YaaR family protein [Spirochaetales bacterium]